MVIETPLLNEVPIVKVREKYKNRRQTEIIFYLS